MNSLSTKAAHLVDTWNKVVLEGSEVLYSSKGDFNDTTTHRTRSAAYLDTSGHPVIFLEGKAGYVSLHHVILKGKESSTDESSTS